MTALDSKLRGFLYVGIAVLAFAGGGVPSLPISDDAKTWAGYLIGLVAAGMVALRAYIDQSPSEVTEPPKEPEPPKRAYQQ